MGGNNRLQSCPVSGRPGAAGQFPDIARHVKKTAPIRWKAANWCPARKPVGTCVDYRKDPVPVVARRLAILHRSLVARRRFAARSRQFPFRFGRQVATLPPGIGKGIGIGHLDDRIAVAALYAAAGSFRVPPAGPRREAPAGIDAAAWHDKNSRARLLLLCRNVGTPGKSALRFGDISGRANELRKLAVGDLVTVNGKTADLDRWPAPFLRIAGIIAEDDCLTCNQDLVRRHLLAASDQAEQGQPCPHRTRMATLGGYLRRVAPWTASSGPSA